MSSHPAELLQSVSAALRQAPALRVSVDEDVVTLEGEAPSFAAKTAAVRAATGVTGVLRVVDRICLPSAVEETDGVLRVRIRDAILDELALGAYSLRCLHKAHWETEREVLPIRGEIRVMVEEGIATLAGRVMGVNDRRLAGLIAWETPGVRGVDNELVVMPPEEDNDDLITDAVRVALHRALGSVSDSIGIRTSHGVVTLRGTVPTGAQAAVAVRHSWHVDGVLEVVDDLSIASRNVE